MMSRHPVVEVRSAGGPSVLVAVHRRLEVGRECDGILVADPLASRRHVALVPDGDAVRAEDLGSSNRTLLNGSELQRPTRLAPGDELLVGDTVIVVTDLVATATTTSPVAAADGPGSGGPMPERATVLRSSEPAAVPPMDQGDLRATTVPGAVVRPTGPAASSGAGDARATSIERVAVDVTDDAEAVRSVASLGAQSGGTLTFAFSDIESSTEQAAAMGDQRWFEVLTVHNRIVEGLVRRHDGQVVKAIGDGFMLTFPSARRAVHAAVAIQQAITEHGRTSPGTSVRVRIGLHTGEAIQSGGDLFGSHVNTAARVANVAAGGEIVVSAITRAITQASGDLVFGPEEQMVLKGLPGTLGVSRLLWEDRPA